MPFVKPFAAAVVLLAAVRAQDPPKVVTLEPAHLAEVEAGKTTRLVVTFDRPMNVSGFSFCGGGPQFPKFLGKPQWQDRKTVVVDVELEPDHQYTLSLNCPAATNFRSTEGKELAPVPWSFTTLPAKVRPAAEQRKRNQAAFAVLTKALAERYAHRDLRVKDWKKLEREHEGALLAAKTDRAFAMAAAAMLQPTADLHLGLKLGDQSFPTGTRQIDTLFRRSKVDQHVKTTGVGPQALKGRTDDGIGYLMIAQWNKDLDPDVIGGAITELADTKAMVIDVRPNSGGDEELAQRVAAWFVAGSKVYAKNRYRVKAGKDGFGPVLERRIEGLDADRVYGKPIAVLTSRYVMSSNESFVLMLKQAKDCVVVGQPTFGSSGNPQPVELGNGVTAMIPSWQDLRPDGSCFEGEGIAPDVPVACTADDLESRDPILEKALELLRAKVAGKRN